MQRVKTSELDDNALTDEPGADSDASLDDLQRQNCVLEEQNRKLQQVAEYRSTFLARLSHELRTPLTSILGFSEILLTREEFSLEDLLREACLGLARQAQKQNAEIHCQAAQALPMIVSDRGKLRQVVYNFLAYAITRSPGALVTASAEKDLAGFVLKIEDEGQVPADSTFVELDPLNRRAGCSDLGLAIARENVDLLGARLSFQNREPRGLRVVIQLPDAPSNPMR